MDQCGLGRSGKTCLLLEELVYVLRANGIKVDRSIDRESAMELLQKKLDCTDERCIVDKTIVAARGTAYEAIIRRIKDMAFKIDGPEEEDALLTTFILVRLARQLEANSGDIRFGGLLTIDFMMPPSVEEFSPRSIWNSFISNRWKQYHLILNIDHRLGMGRHWTALVIDTDIGEIQYFDSYGRPPPDGLVQGTRFVVGITDKDGMFMSMLGRWATDVRNLFIESSRSFKSSSNEVMMKRIEACKNMKVVYSRIAHQEHEDRANCGVYSILFLTLRAAGRSMIEINKQKLNKSLLDKMREIFYRPTSDYRSEPPPFREDRPFAASSR